MLLLFSDSSIPPLLLLLFVSFCAQFPALVKAYGGTYFSMNPPRSFPVKELSVHDSGALFSPPFRHCVLQVFQCFPERKRAARGLSLLSNAFQHYDFYLVHTCAHEQNELVS